MPILTNFSELDDILGGGLKPGELTVVAGRPGIGKTAFCWSMARNIKQSGKKVCIVATQDGCLIKGTPFGIDTYNYLPPFDEMVKNLKNEKYDVVFFTALHPANSKEAEDIYGKLKTLATEENIAVVVEAVVGKIVEKIKPPRPNAGHIKYFKAVEKHVDTIMLVYRGGYYDATADDSEFEVVVAKSRAGECGTVMLKYGVEEISMNVRIPQIKE